MPLKIYVALVAGSIFGAGGQFLLKMGANGRDHFTAFLNWWIFGGLVAYGVGTLLWVYALSRAKLTMVYPFTALTFVLIYLIGVLFLHEPTTAKALIGVALVLGGLFLVSAA